MEFNEMQCNAHYMSHVTCNTCYMSQNIKLQTILPNTQGVIYFWKAHAKYSSMVLVKTLHVTYVTCHMSHMLHVTNIKLLRIYQIPYMLYIFGNVMQNPAQWL